MRIQKALAHLGVGSRRYCEGLVSEGRVTLDGQPVQIGQSVSPEEVTRLQVDGKSVGSMPEKRYVLLNKPAGFVTTVSDPQRRKTVMDLIPNNLGRLYPVGRLDRQTLGVLLFTNDGELAHQLLHPSKGVEKEYKATVSGKISKKALALLRAGPELDDGPTQPPKEVRHKGNDIWLIIKEGRKRQVRRMLKEVGLRCEVLERLCFGGLTASGLKPGETRELTLAEVKSLQELVANC